MSERPEKRQRTEGYILYYWKGLPGRGEYIRLALEYAGIPYSEHNSSLPHILSSPSLGFPPHFAPPALQLPSGFVLSQTGAILTHIAPRCGLAGPLGNAFNTADPSALRALSPADLIAAEEQRSTVNQLTLTALDWQDEAHNVHHPVAAALYYDDQKDAAAQAADNFRKNRIPKFLGYFDSVLVANPANAKGEGKTYLVGKQTTTADLMLFHVIDGLLFAFPKRMAQLRAGGKYDSAFALYQRVKGEKGIKEYLASGRRHKFSSGIFRYYEELDGEEAE